MSVTWQEIAQGFEEQITFCQDYSPLYHDLYKWLYQQAAAQRDSLPLSAGGAAMVAMVEAAWSGRPINGSLEASLLMPAAIHASLLLEDTAAEGLRPFYATVGGQYHPATDQVAFFAALESLFSQHSEVVEWFLTERFVQTNEVSRSVAWLIPAYVFSQWQPDLSITLVDFGCSAALNLSADYQHWRWELDGQTYQQGAAPFAFDQTLHPEDSDDPALREHLPAFFGNDPQRLKVIQRIGFDRSPLDIHSELDQAALKACIWGDQPDRMERFESAIAGFGRMEADGHSVRLYTGDLLKAAQALPNLISEDIPRPHLLMVFNSAVTSYFSDNDYHELRTQLMHSFQRLPEGVQGIWLENEVPRYNEQLDHPKHFMMRARMPFLGGISSVYLGELEAHPRNVYLRKGWDLLRQLLWPS